ncbi:TlpA family protein disulfide reductase [bacterium]|nr:TlpA family protein disulfide reductase [candidate division CSSED10-310 bacterium]
MVWMQSGFSGRTGLCLLLLLAMAAPALAAKPPLFELKTLDGAIYRLSDDLGEAVIIFDFWATWCKPCLREMPHINQIYERFKDRGLRAYAVSIDEAASKSKIAPTIKRYKFTLPVLVDENQSVIRKYNPSKNVPYLVIIGKDGEILREFNGYKPGDEKLVEEIVEKACSDSTGFKPVESTERNRDESGTTGISSP